MFKLQFVNPANLESRREYFPLAEFRDLTAKALILGGGCPCSFKKEKKKETEKEHIKMARMIINKPVDSAANTNTRTVS